MSLGYSVDQVLLFCGALFLVICFLVALWPRQIIKRSHFSSPFWLTLYLGGTVPPVGGLALCLFIASVFHGANTNRTHCGVYNFWPSVSSAIGNNAPEKYIWRLAVGLHNTITLLDSFLMYHNLVQNGASVVWSRICVVCRISCNMSLFMLTFVTSTEDFALHQAGFVLWLISGSFMMVLFALLWRTTSRHASDEVMTKGRRWLTFWYSLYFSLIPLAVFLYWLHNKYCQPYVYSIFGICEFLIVIAYVFGGGWGHHVCFDNSSLMLEFRRPESKSE